MQIATMCHTSSLFADGPTMHWVGPETLLSLKVKGHEVNSLADSGSQVNTVMPGYVHQHEFPVCLWGLCGSPSQLGWIGWHEDSTSWLHDTASISHRD